MVKNEEKTPKRKTYFGKVNKGELPKIRIKPGMISKVDRIQDPTLLFPIVEKYKLSRRWELALEVGK